MPRSYSYESDHGGLIGREELRRRFVKAELALFKIRYDSDDYAEREGFLNSRDFGWEAVGLCPLSSCAN